METVTAEPGDNYLEIVLKADVVTVATALRLIDAIAANLDRRPCGHTLVEVIAHDSDVSLTDSYVIWDYARERSLCRTKLAYVVTGSEVKPYPAFTESCATKRGTPLRIFSNRKDAMEWLGPALGGSSPKTVVPPVAVPGTAAGNILRGQHTMRQRPSKLTLEHQT